MDNANTENDAYNTNCECEGTVYTSFTDSRDGQSYRTFKIDTESGERRVEQTWLAENMNYSTGNSWCYDDLPSNCEIYGRLYDWETAKTACPSGWHLPTAAEWTILTDYLGGPSVAGGKMKEVGTAHWSGENIGATNSSGFTGLPGGIRNYSGGSFSVIGVESYWWSSTVSNIDLDYVWYLSLTTYGENLAPTGIGNDKRTGMHCRCVQGLVYLNILSLANGN